MRIISASFLFFVTLTSVACAKSDTIIQAKEELPPELLDLISTTEEINREKYTSFQKVYLAGNKDIYSEWKLMTTLRAVSYIHLSTTNWKHRLAMRHVNFMGRQIHITGKVRLILI